MDPSSRLPADDDDGSGWDADDFQIPSLDTAGGKQAGAGPGPGQGEGRSDAGTAMASGASHSAAGSGGGQGIYLGPHGGPRKHPEPQPRKQRLKHRLKDADKKAGGGSGAGGRENKVEVLRDLMGAKSGAPALAGPATDWLEPYCQESQFDRTSPASRG